MSASRNQKKNEKYLYLMIALLRMRSTKYVLCEFEKTHYDGTKIECSNLIFNILVLFQVLLGLPL